MHSSRWSGLPSFRCKRSQLRRSLYSSFAAVALLGSACGDAGSSADPNAAGEEATELGRVSLSLRARGRSGAEYRLRRATFLAGDPELPAPDVQLSTEEDPDATQLSTEMRVGDFIIVLLDGWQLERLDPVPQVVDAELLSEQVQEFSIAAGEETFVSYRFQTGTDIVELDTGRLVVAIEVQESGPVLPPPPPPGDCPQTGLDDLYALLVADVLSQDPEDREFLRYVSLADRANAGVCGAALDIDRFALSKLVNSLSINARIEEPIALDANELVFRVDIRDYGWDRDIVFDGEVFDDGWEAIASAARPGLTFEGDEAEMTVLQTNTNTPWFPLSVFARATTTDVNLYSALAGIPESFEALTLDELGIERADTLDQREMIRAFVSTRLVSSAVPLLVERNEIEVRAGSYWLARELSSEVEDPTELLQLDVSGSARVMFQLPNGLPAFASFGQDGVRTALSPNLLRLGADQVSGTPLACMDCHRNGPLPAQDEFRPFALRNPQLFDADDFEAVQELYPASQEFASRVDEDAAQVTAALTRAGVPVTTEEPIHAVNASFRRDLFLPQAAAELMVSEDVLSANIVRLHPELAVLAAGGSVPRELFEQHFLDSLCVINTFSQNRPMCR